MTPMISPVIEEREREMIVSENKRLHGLTRTGSKFRRKSAFVLYQPEKPKEKEVEEEKKPDKDPVIVDAIVNDPSLIFDKVGVSEIEEYLWASNNS